MSVVFPFTAIVGQERMRRALILNAVNPRIGGRPDPRRARHGQIHRRPRPGGAAARSAGRRRLPLRLRPGPADDLVHRVPRARQPPAKALPTALRRTSFVDLPVSATEDRVVGTLDIERAIKEGERHFEPGVLAAANRGLLYIDEVNLLDDHVVDLLLDSAALGMNIVEREGISFTHPARFILVGTMNPEEGDLRPQLLDRFALSVEIHGLREPADRIAIMERILAFETDPDGFRHRVDGNSEQTLSREIDAARRLVDHVGYSPRDLFAIAALTASLHVDGHRADLVILKAARAHAAFEGRDRHHRSRHRPGGRAGAAPPPAPRSVPAGRSRSGRSAGAHRADPDASRTDAGQPKPKPPKPTSPAIKKKPQHSLAEEGDEEKTHAGPLQPGQQPASTSFHARWWEGGDKVHVGETFAPRRLDSADRQTDPPARADAALRPAPTASAAAISPPGRPMGTPATSPSTPPCARRRRTSAAAVQRGRGWRFAIEPSDLQRKVRVRRAANLILFVVDASWSMAVAERMSATKGAILSLLTDAYQRRDRVGLIVFQKDRALTVLPPTNSVQLAHKALADIPVGGKTPLSAGLRLAYELFQQERLAHPEILPLMILLTDGAGNVSMSHLPPQEEAHAMADLICQADVRAVVINMEHAAFDQGLATTLAERLGGPCYTLAELKAENLYRAVRQQLDGPAERGVGETLHRGH